jgi:hypothetical protein
VGGRACDGCSSNNDCLNGHCDTANGICQVTGCSDGGTELCGETGYACDGTTNSCSCALSPVCGYCSADTDCSGGATCDPSLGQCQSITSCLTSGGCSYQGYSCGADGGCLCQ